MIIAVLALLGLCMGSFVNALVWRLHKQSKKGLSKKVKRELSIIDGRSKCTHCGHKLDTLDLVPLLSWIFLGGKCRYCRQPISVQYPLVELLTTCLFVISYLFWPVNITGWETVTFGLWLVCLTGLVALIIYDLRWMLLPNRIIFPLYFVAILITLTRMFNQASWQPLLAALLGVLVGGGIFYVLFQLSDGKWIGGGDVKLGFLLGALVASPLNAILVIFGASLLGSVVSMVLMISGKASRNTRIPFGPFLIMSAILVQLAGSAIISWYTNAFINI